MAGKTTTAEERKAGLATTDDDDAEVTQVLAAIDTTQPLDQRGNGAAMVPARTDEARKLADATAHADRGVKLARNLTHQRDFARLLTEAQQVGRLQDLLIEVGNHHDANDLAPDELKHRIVQAIRAWVVGGEVAAP